eukprot:Hpha_TRINITY_DN960_c0_g1::TRINITY_DN960_c0_g1_i1::g.156345::m.156345
MPPKGTRTAPAASVAKLAALRLLADTEDRMTASRLAVIAGIEEGFAKKLLANLHTAQQTRDGYRRLAEAEQKLPSRSRAALIGVLGQEEASPSRSPSARPPSSELAASAALPPTASPERSLKRSRRIARGSKSSSQGRQH